MADGCIPRSRATPSTRWGDEADEDESGTDGVTTVRPTSQGGSMAVLDGAVLWSWHADVLEDGINAATGDGDSLADDDEQAALAEAMDDLGAMGAVFSSEVYTSTDPRSRAATTTSTTRRPTSCSIPMRRSPRALHTGEDGPAILVVLLHDDEDEAEEKRRTSTRSSRTRMRS